MSPDRPAGPEIQAAVSYHIRPFSEPRPEERDADKARLHHALVALGIFRPEDVVSDEYYEDLRNTATRGKLNKHLAQMVPPFTPDDDTFAAQLEEARRAPLLGTIADARQRIGYLQHLLEILGRLKPGSYVPGTYDGATEKALIDINRHRRGSKDIFAIGITNESFCHSRNTLNALVALLEEAPADAHTNPRQSLSPTLLAHEVAAKKAGLTPADAYQLHCVIANMKPGERPCFDVSSAGVASPLPGTIAPYDPVQVTGYSAAALNRLYDDVRRTLRQSKRFVLIKEGNGQLRVKPYASPSPVTVRRSFAPMVGRFVGIVSLASVFGTAMGLALSGPETRRAFRDDPIEFLKGNFAWWRNAYRDRLQQAVDQPSHSNRVDQMELPENISDMGTILYAAQPSWDTRTGVSYEALISRYAVARHLFEGKLLLTEVRTERSGERRYAFTIPDERTGETLDFGEGTDTMNHVTWPDVLRLATRAHEVSDEVLAGFIARWYQEVYSGEDRRPVTLNPDFLRFDRDAHGVVTQVFYDGPGADQAIFFNERVANPTISSSGAQPAFSMESTYKKLTGQDHRLLIYTGAGQPFLVPESFLVQDRTITLDLGNETGRFEFTASELALDIREWFERRDDRTTFLYRDIQNNLVATSNVERFVIHDTPAIQRLVAQTLRGARSPRERRERLRRLGQSAPYQGEASVTDVYRPPLATLLQGYHEDSGGDCSHRSILLAAVLTAGGFRVGLVHAERRPVKGSPPSPTAHMFVAVHEDAFEDLSETSLLDMNRVNFRNRPDELWIAVETGGNRPYGDVPLLEEMDPIYMREVQ